MAINCKIFKVERGYTLFEVIIVVIILSIVSVLAINLMSRQTEVFTSVFNDAKLLSDARKALEYIRRDLHGTSADSISSMTASNLAFQKSDGSSISYIINAATLQRNGIALAENIASNPFSYLDANQNLTASTSNLVFVKVNLNMGNLGESIQLEEIIFLRN
jgi:prepilin-type N-terminal cleavage/methylation domain-containing protein